ncbi:MAG TPA: DUF885 domain-containing protein [Mycobacteriales bacterium]|nr:DUF885 domain-containing protein [Mycobacteriales bacterium]
MTTQGSAVVAGLADEMVAALVEVEPLDATLAGVRDRDGELADLSEAGQAAQAQRLRRIAAAAAAVDRAGLTAADRLTCGTVGILATDTADLLATARPEWQVTDQWVGPAGRLLVNLPQCTLPEPASAAAYLRRLAAVPGYLATAAQRHRAGVRSGRAPVARLVRAAIDQVDGYLADPGADPLRLTAPAGADGFPAELADVLERAVRPAFRAYREALTELAPAGRDDEHAGLCWLPGGEGLYQTLVRTQTTTARTPEELHRTGLELIAALAQEYAEIGGRVFGVTDPAEVMRRMRTDPALRCTSREQILAEARDAVARAEAVAPRWFGQLPEQPCQVAPVPRADEARSVLAYYVQPAMDGSRPGIYWQNTRNPTEQHRHVLQFTAFHEAVPGHHLQLALAVGRSDLPLLRRMLEIAGYVEGWALYCERLADEMGLYTDDVSRLGMLAGDSLRAARLVVDTGVHAHGWSRAQVVAYLAANTPLPPADVQVETDRYIGDPGQALAYMVGRLEIVRLRTVAERQLGAGFDIRAFHDVVLGTGTVPLASLAEHVETWLAGQAQPA